MPNLFTRNRVTGLLIAAVIFVVDQAIKYYLLGPLKLRLQPEGKIDLLPFFDLRYTENLGISLGLLQATSQEMRWILVALTAIIALVVLVWMFRERLMGEIFGLSLILGGALGNIVDRSMLGYVVDYADFHIGSFRPFLIFNLADAAITIGVVIILARSFFVRDDARNTDAPA